MKINFAHTKEGVCKIDLRENIIYLIFFLKLKFDLISIRMMSLVSQQYLI